MVEENLKTIAPAVGAEETLTALTEVRDRTISLVSHLSREDLERVHSPIMSPLVWDLAHIAAYEDLWLVHRHAGRPLLRADLAGVYDAFETPRSVRGDVKLLDVPETLRYLAQVRDRARAAVEDVGVGDGFLHELVLRHELQHTETMLQTMALADLLPSELRRSGEVGCKASATTNATTRAPGGIDWVSFEAGGFSIGAQSERFAYDNERPRHEVELGAFRIAREPVSEADWRRFESEGGYQRREWWSPQGWEWREQTEPARHQIARGEPREIACHVSFHEAEAYARSRGARLPSEAEWEVAATAPGEPLRGVGVVWEWTSSEFDGYPGFAPYPYREYSEVFFKRGYRVLRGGSWAAHPRVATRTFRNWDLPERRQIFSGLRLAMDE